MKDTLNEFLKGVVERDNSNEEIDKHTSLAKEAQSLLGGDLKDYLKMYDRDLQDAITIAKRKKNKK